MNADNFFEKYSIEEISKRTKISPISLRFIKNKEFEKIPRTKFMGFLKIIEKEFNINLDELRNEYNSIKKEEKEIKIEVETEKSNNLLLIIIGIILLGTGGYFLLKNSPKEPKEIKISEPIKTKIEINKTKEIKKDNENLKLTTYKKLSPIKLPEKKEVNKTKKTTKYEVTIIPYEKVWYKALNIDTNKTFEYLTSKIKVLPKGDYYIKFGHGNVSILYNEYNITPNTKKIVRILLKDGNYTYMKKPNRYEK